MNNVLLNTTLVTLIRPKDSVLLRLTVTTREHGSSRAFLIDSARLSRWLHDDHGTFAEFDLNNVLRLYREGDGLIYAELMWISIDGAEALHGYRQSFLLSASDWLLAADGTPVNRLAPTGHEHTFARVIVSDSAQRRIARLNKLQRRALSKALRSSFRWNNTTVTLHADSGYDFFFSEKAICGGLCMHTGTASGSDGFPHTKYTYSVHT